MEEIAATPPKQREPQTLWKMVEAKCSQISDATTTVRLSLFLALTWSFLWLAALYVSELGYTQVYRQRVTSTRRRRRLSHSGNGSRAFVPPVFAGRG